MSILREWFAARKDPEKVDIILITLFVLGLLIGLFAAGPSNAVMPALIGVLGAIGGAASGQYLAGKNAKEQIRENQIHQKTERLREEKKSVYLDALKLITSIQWQLVNAISAKERGGETKKNSRKNCKHIRTL